MHTHKHTNINNKIPGVGRTNTSWASPNHGHAGPICARFRCFVPWPSTSTHSFLPGIHRVLIFPHTHPNRIENGTPGQLQRQEILVREPAKMHTRLQQALEREWPFFPQRREKPALHSNFFPRNARADWPKRLIILPRLLLVQCYSCTIFKYFIYFLKYNFLILFDKENTSIKVINMNAR